MYVLDDELFAVALSIEFPQSESLHRFFIVEPAENAPRK
jgi:hypothetical protein